MDGGGGTAWCRGFVAGLVIGSKQSHLLSALGPSLGWWNLVKFLLSKSFEAQQAQPTLLSPTGSPVPAFLRSQLWHF